MNRRNASAQANRKRRDRDKLDLFLKLAAELGTTDLAKKGFGYKHSMKWSRTEGFKQEFEQPDENDLRSFLTTFRKFISKKSDAYLQSIHGIFYERLTREEYREDLGKMNTTWRHLFRDGWMRLTINGRECPPERTLYVYINGRYFHDDVDYAEELAQLEQQPDQTAALLHRAQFLEALVGTSKYIDWLAGNLDYCLREGLLDFDDETKPGEAAVG
jgi:hypothetical protein